MAEHGDLVAEIMSVEKMGTLERLRHAKKRRVHQLKKFTQYEKQLDKASRRRKGGSGGGAKGRRAAAGNVHFVGDVMLLEAAARNDLDEVRELLVTGISPDAMNEDGLTALHQCCIDDLEEMMKLLIEFGANVNACDSELWTSLHAAATCGHWHLCSYLIEHEAHLLAVNADGNMPYDLCEDEGTLDFIESQMAQRGVTQQMIDETRLSTETRMLTDLKEIAADNGDLEFKGHSGETPLHIAIANGYLQVAQFLLAQHVSLDAIDVDSWQPIHAAACWGQLSMVELLVEHGADLDATTRIGETPHDICEDYDMKKRIIELQNEIASHRATTTHELTRRRSQNTRSSLNSNTGTNVHYNSNSSLVEKSAISASIRRTSMREKSAMHWREAQDEAKRMRASVESGSANGDANGDGDDDKTKTTTATSSTRSAPLATPEQVEVAICCDSLSLHSPSQSTAKTRAQKMKTVVQADQPSSSARVNGANASPKVSVQDRMRNFESRNSVQPPPITEPAVADRPPVNRAQEAEPVAAEPQRQAPRTPGSPTKTADSSSKTADTSSKTADNSSRKVAAPVRPANSPSKVTNVPPKTANVPPKTANVPPKTANVPRKTANVPPKTTNVPPKTTNASSKTADRSAPQKPANQPSPRPTRSPASPATKSKAGRKAEMSPERQAGDSPHIGTLADLKKQRSQRLQDALRGREGLPRADGAALGNGKGEANGSVQTSISSGSAADGIAAAGAGARAGAGAKAGARAGAGSGTEQPIRRFSSANAEIVGSEQRESRETEECCAIL